MLTRMLVIAAALGLASICHAQTSGKVDLWAAELATELIGAPVFAADGSQVGEVADISFNEEDQPRRLRFKTASALGLGARAVEVPHGTFMLLRGAVVLDLPAEAVEALPEVAEDLDEK